MSTAVGTGPQRRGERERGGEHLAAGWVIWLAVMITGGAALADAAASDAAIVFEPCELRGSGGLGRVAAECGFLNVAEDPERPDGARLNLFVARIRALAANPAADAFTIINGGPGASSVSLYVDLQPAFAPLRRDRDIIVVDQRGTGRSAPLECPALEQAAQEFDVDEVRRATRACLGALQQDPRFYTTALAVNDLESLRRSLGYATWNLYGVSYGTRVAQHYLRRFPGAVRTLVLDGVAPPDQALGPDIALNAQKSLDAVMARCAEEAPCAAAFPDLPLQFQQFGERLKAAPLELELPHPVTGRVQPFTLGYGHFAMTVRLLSYAPETVSLIPLVVAEAATRGNYLPIASQALRIERDLGEAISFGMHNSVVCTEDAPFYGDLTSLRPALEAAYLGDEQVRALEAICELWPRGVLDPESREPVASSRPVLLMSGEFDPVTPPEYAERAAVRLDNSRHLVARGQGHGVVARGCMPNVVGDFIASGRLDSLDVECLARLAGDSFFVDLLGPPP
jgi:pimeloyl-ACP methyl ester carboxylesterase